MKSRTKYGKIDRSGRVLGMVRTLPIVARQVRRGVDSRTPILDLAEPINAVITSPFHAYHDISFFKPCAGSKRAKGVQSYWQR
jgi:hypothetical protein